MKRRALSARPSTKDLNVHRYTSTLAKKLDMGKQLDRDRREEEAYVQRHAAMNGSKQSDEEKGANVYRKEYTTSRGRQYHQYGEEDEEAKAYRKEHTKSHKRKQREKFGEEEEKEEENGEEKEEANVYRKTNTTSRSRQFDDGTAVVPGAPRRTRFAAAPRSTHYGMTSHESPFMFLQSNMLSLAASSRSNFPRLP
jgi:hypothetical protein